MFLLKDIHVLPQEHKVGFILDEMYKYACVRGTSQGALHDAWRSDNAFSSELDPILQRPVTGGSRSSR